VVEGFLELRGDVMATVLAKTNAAARWLWSWTRSLVVALFVWFLISTFLVQAFRITSGSMERTVLVGDFLFVNKLLYGAEVPLAHRHLPPIREPAHDEVVVIKSPIEDLLLLKRIVGLPGDTIAMFAGAALAPPMASAVRSTALVVTSRPASSFSCWRP
jgi:signal peptidase I